LRSVVAESDSIVDIQWDPVDADAYAVWLSPDGRTWDLGDARLVTEAGHRAGMLPFGPVLYVRITAVSLSAGGPVHSDPSDTYAVSTGLDGARVLVVDGNDRWSSGDQPENPLGWGHGFVVDYAETLGDMGFDTVANEAVIDDEVSLSDYDAVVWILGEESDADRTFDDLEQMVVRAYVDEGGHLMASGSELGYDLVELGTPADADFFSEVLGASYDGDDAGTVVARPTEILSGDTGPWVGFNRPGTLDVQYPDRLAPAAGAETWMSYAAGLGGAAMVVRSAAEGRGATAVLGVPFEAIDDPAQRAALMSSVLQHFGL
jgi:hypothetical protein